jgi:hypothetical protein
VADCKCKPGYGSLTGEGICRLCPEGTFSTGRTMEDCKPCPFGTTSAAGIDDSEKCVPVAQACPVGMFAPENAVAPQQCQCYPGYGYTGAGCDICPPGTYAEGNGLGKCLPCGFGFSSADGATNKAECFSINSCPAGTGEWFATAWSS